MSGPLKKDGTPDMRYAANRSTYLSSGTTVSGTPDMRYSTNRNTYASPGRTTHDTPDMRYSANRDTYLTPGTRVDGNPDMRYRENKAQTPKPAPAVVKPKQPVPVTPSPVAKPKPTSTYRYDMRLRENRQYLPSHPTTGGPTNVDGGPDMRSNVNRKLIVGLDDREKSPVYRKPAPKKYPTPSPLFGDQGAVDDESTLSEDLISWDESLSIGSYPTEYSAEHPTPYVDQREEAVLASKPNPGHYDTDEDDTDEDFSHKDSSIESQTTTELVKKDGNSEYIHIWYRRQHNDEDTWKIGRKSCLQYDSEHLNAKIDDTRYEPISFGWKVSQISVGDDVLLLCSGERDSTVTFPELKKLDKEDSRFTDEIIYGPDRVCGRDKETGDYVIGCITWHHGKGVKHSWYLNGEEFKSGKDLSVIHVREEGEYHCRVRYGEKQENSCSVEIVSMMKVPADIKMRREDLTLDEELGSGSFGTVWRGKWKGTVVSIKEVPLKLAEVPQEVEIARKLRHPNIVTLLGAIVTKVKFYMVNQYVHGDNLNELLHTLPKKQQLKVNANGYVVYQVGLGLQYLHRNKIIHRDIKPANILVEVKNMRTYICDFGVAEQRETFATTSSTRDGDLRGTMAYCAKESLQGSSMKSKPCVDVYAYGCTLYEVYSRKMVWSGCGIPEMMTKILSGQYPPMEDTGDALVQQILQQIFVEAQDRPTMDGILPVIKVLLKY